MDKYKDGQSVWHVAVGGGNDEVLGKLCSWAKGQQIKRENLIDSFFLDEHWDGRFACHLANEEVLHNLPGLSEEAQIQEDDQRSAIFLNLDKRGKLPDNWHKGMEG